MTKGGSRERGCPERFVVAIDGPAGAGKTTVARELAGHLGFAYIDTGAMYRALTLKTLRAGIAPEDEEAVAAIAESTDIALRDGGVLLDGEDVRREIRTHEVTRHVSRLAAHPAVRKRMVELQRLFVRGCVVIEGRDIGTVVMPDADVKIFLTAAAPERARRRAKELTAQEEAGEDTPGVVEVLRQILVRDRTDMTRDISPLKPASDAVIVDTTGRSVESIVDEIASIVDAAARRPR